MNKNHQNDDFLIEKAIILMVFYLHKKINMVNYKKE